MGYMLNQGKGRSVELMKRVDGNDPANSAIVLVPLSAVGTEAEAQDYDSLSALLGGTANEATGSNWARKVLTDADIAAHTPDDVNNRGYGALPQSIWSAVAAANDTAGLAVCYDSDTTAGTDANIEVLGVLDFVVETDGNDVVQNAGDWMRAT